MPSRTIVNIPVTPIIGSSFQPTGFPDIGAATFDRPTVDGQTEPCVLVESTQSMANRLEGTLWDDATNSPHPAIEGLPWVRVTDPDGSYLTGSRTEAHRLASAFVREATIDGTPVADVMLEKFALKADTPHAPRDIAAAIFALDPLCLLHGVFFALKGWPGQPKIARAITGVVEAHGVTPVVSGGVKTDHVRHSLGEAEGGTSEGYGMVPYTRTDYTAREIVASFAIDHNQIRAYGLPPEATALLETLALWEIRTLAENGMRFRTACDLTPVDNTMLDRVVPSVDDLAARIETGMAATASMFDTAGPTDAVWTSKKASK